MTLTPALCLHLETAVLFVFLIMSLAAQLARSRDPARRAQNPRRQFLALAAVFLLANGAFLAPLLSVSPLLSAELAAGVTLALLHPVNALCLLVHMLFLRPWEVMPGNPLLSALPRLLAGVCALSWLVHPEFRRSPGPRTSRVLALLTGFSAWLFVTTFVTPDAAAAQLDWFNTYFKVFIVFVMCLFFVGDARGVEQLKQAIVISVLGMASLALVEFLFFSAPAESGFSRLHSHFTVLDPNDLAAVIVMAFPFVLEPLFRGGSGAGRQITALVLAAACAATVWYSQSRGAFIALFAQVVGARILQDPRRRWFGGLLLAAFLGAGYVGVLKSSTRSQEDMGASTESRLVYWKAALNMTLHNLVFGVGYDEYPRSYESYSTGAKYEWGERTAHSTWLLAFAESGVVGGFLLAAFFAAVWKTAWRGRRERPGQLHALLGYGVAMSFLSHTYLLYPYLLCGLILAADAVKETSHAA